MHELNLTWHEVDGVTAVCAGAGEIAGPLRAVLTFGVGVADESLRTHGISHVVEHLALHHEDHPPALLFNGAAESMTTNFSVAGTPEQVVDFFTFVTGRLADLPLDRLEDELRLLQVEAVGRGSSPIGRDLEERFGPRGGGLLAWPELGLRTVDRDDVAAWSRARFTASNAVLWCSGPLPDGLSLRALPDGEAPVRAQCPEPRTPSRAYVPLRRKPVGVSFVAEPSWLDGPAVELLRQLAFERLRAAALSYAVNSTMIRLDRDTRYWCITADGIDGELDRVVRELVACIEEVTAHGPTEDTVDELRARWALARSNPDRLVNFLDNAARRHLFGLDQYTLAEQEEHADAVTTESLRAGLELIAPTALAFGPELGRGVPQGWTRHAGWERSHVTGRRLEPIPGRERGTMIAGFRGVTKRFDDGSSYSARWEEVEACIVEGSAWHLVDGSGTVVTVDPACWRGGEYLEQLVRDHVGPSRMIHFRRSASTDRTPDHRAHDYWLATIAGVTAKRVPDVGSGTVSLVVDTDGLFVIREDDEATDGAVHPEVLRSADREELLAADARNRWIPRASLETVELLAPVVKRAGASHHRLRVRTKTGTVLCFRLSNPKQVELARGAISAMLGRRFHERPGGLRRLTA